MADGTLWLALSLWETVASTSEPGEGAVYLVRANETSEGQFHRRAPQVALPQVANQ